MQKYDFPIVEKHKKSPIFNGIIFSISLARHENRRRRHDAAEGSRTS